MFYLKLRRIFFTIKNDRTTGMPIKQTIIRFLSVLLFLTANILHAQFELPAVFGNNMVRQQKTFAPFWGKAKPNQHVSIKTSWGAATKTVAGSDVFGKLKLKLSHEKNNFQIAGPDSIFKDAVVHIKGKTIAVSSPEIHDPVAVRYCWGNTLEATLFNKAGLPASSFRTDSWK